GVDILQPLITDYSQNEAYAAPRAAAITRAAAEQSRRLSLPEILPPVRINDVFAAPATDKIDRYFCCVEHENLPALLSTAERELLRLKAEKSLPSPNNSSLIQFGLVIGPEGGFSPREVALLSGLSSARLVTLGKEILRTETASLVGLSLLKALIPHILTQE
ncbi:MAG: RsmE family RNA methyltransferase, partial [Alphaproteobacteria bacterium]|nr:RsmE family RNA methyltransferase [Alphaproteobacteria bacterium]